MFSRWEFIFLIIASSGPAWSQVPSTGTKKTVAPPAATTPLEKATVPKDRFITRSSLVFDYNSWFQNLSINASTPFETKALIYGLGISYEYNLLRLKWGWGLGGGIIHSYGVSGDSSDVTTYYVKRVPLEMGRGIARIFSRISPRLDLGLLGNILYTLTNWPSSNGFSVQPSSNLLIGVFLDSRWRLDRHWELVQAVGTFNRGPSLAWRLGANYNF